MSMKPKKRVSKQSDIEKRIIPVADVEQGSSFAIYGRAGSGKTTLASTFPKPLLLLDINDKGTDSIADVKGVDYLQVECMDDIEDIYYDVLRGGSKYKTVVFDTITEMQRMLLNEIVGNDKKATSLKNAKPLGSWGTVRRQDWGKISGIMNKWITDFRDLDMQVVFLAQERVKNVNNDEEEEADNQLSPEVGAAVMPSIATTLNAAVNIIGNTFIRMKRTTVAKGNKKTHKEEPQYCLRIGPNPIYSTKIRKPRSAEAPPFIENPTYDDIVSLVKGE